MHRQTWKSYEEVAQYLLHRFRDEFGLDRVEPKQKLPGRSGTDWEVDAKGVREDSNSAVILIECRQHRTKRLNQEAVAGLAFRILDTGASGGILVTPLPLQEGATKIAAHSNIVSVVLGPDSTPEDFTISFLAKILVSRTENVTVAESVTIKLEPLPSDE